MTSPPIFCALDTVDLDFALYISEILNRHDCGIKIGLEFFNANGPEAVKKLKDKYPTLPVFLDLKFHDIPNTVSAAIKAVMPLEPAYLNVHASGGLEMMKRAKETILETSEKYKYTKPKLLGVTILTSLDTLSLKEIGFSSNNVEDSVLKLAQLTKTAGLEGIVCSAKEAPRLRNTFGDDFILMVPGIRPVNKNKQDQKRTMDPLGALNNGATHLVIGRPITESKEPESTLQAILETIKHVPDAA
jgi:orotidine-5'-phosphate decarboxylase